MFDFKGLPETVNEEFLQRELITNGAVGFAEFNGDLYSLRGNYGGEPDEYYLPTEFIISNPVLGSKTINIGENGVVMFGSTSDRFAPYIRDGIAGKGKKKGTLWGVRGSVLYNYIYRTAQILYDIDISAISVLKTSRVSYFVSVKDDQKKAAAELALERLFNGELSTVFESDILDSIKFDFAPQSQSAAALMRELAEKYQFYLAEFYHAIGVNSNYNLKRERLNTAEVQLNDEPLLINIADMLECRQRAAEEINKMFGTSITVELSEEWRRDREQADDSGGGGASENADDSPGVDGENDEPGDDNNSGGGERSSDVDSDRDPDERRDI